MHSLDIRKLVIRPSEKKHSQHSSYRSAVSRQARKQAIRRSVLMCGFFIVGTFMAVPQMLRSEVNYWAWSGSQQAEIQKVRTVYLSRYAALPVEEEDPKLQALTAYLQDKKSPLVKYAGELSRLTNWKMLLGIAQAESNLCKKTNKNNCWGIGPNNAPLSYNDISESLHYANYLMDKYGSQGMNPQRPETIVRTYVGYDHPGWVNTVHSVFAELKQRGLN